EPRLAVLDETDSGLDIDAMRIVADGVNRLRSPQRAMVVITHYQRLLNYIVPDVVHVLSKGRIVKTGGKELALELEARGYAQSQEEAAGGFDERRGAPDQNRGRRGLGRGVRRPPGGTGARSARGAAQSGVPPLCRRGLAAPARRGLEIHRSARAHARGKA